jgi:eukaryotic-like serine/threonine-protein kinase
MSAWQVPGYSEDRELGRGSFGRVVAATNDASGRHVAIKYLKAELFSDPEFLAGFREEARLLGELDVPQVVKVLAYVEEPGRGAAIVMELVDGVSLHELITQQGPTQPESALAVLKGSLLGLASTHALGVVHRDYKPENVLVDAEGMSKLTDFGLATRAGRRAPAAGTPLYMAPEQWAGQAAGPASDIYAATAVFFECLTGRPPFEGPIRQLREQHEHTPVPAVEVAEPFRGLLERGMAKDPAERPPDAAAFVFELENAAAAAAGPDWEARGRSQLKERAAALLLLLGGATGGTSGTATVTTWLGRHKAVAVAAAVAVIALVSGGIAVASNGGHQHQPPPGNGITVVSQSQVGASATVVPPTAAVSCATPAAFSYMAALTVSQPGLVSYRWIYSSGTPGPVHTLQASHAGTYSVSGGVVKASTTGTGWARVQVTNPLTVTSNKAVYQLTCVIPAITIALSSQPPSPHNVQCGTAPPAVTINGQITSTVAGQLSYHWIRSNGSQTAAHTVNVSAGKAIFVSDIVTPSADSYSGSDDLSVSGPVSASKSIAITLTCTTPSHVSSVTVSNPTLSTMSCSSAQQTVTGSFTIVIHASSTAPVQLNWTTSQNSTPPPSSGTTNDSGSQVLSGQTSYTVTINNASFGSLAAGGPCAGGYFVAAATATGSDGVAVTANPPGSVLIHSA